MYTKTIWVNGEAPAINATNLNKIETEIEKISSMAINPDDYVGTDFEKLQLAINAAISGKKDIILSRMYDITGSGTLMLSAKYGSRGWTRFNSLNNGGIVKSDAGFMFSSSTADTSDFMFNNIKFEGHLSYAVKCFDCDKLIGISTNNCYFYKLYNIFYNGSATRYLQSISMNGDLIFQTVEYSLNCNGAFNTKIINILQEVGYGGFFKHRGDAGTYNYCAGLSIIGCGVELIQNSGAPCISLKNCRGVNIVNNYFEVNAGGGIKLDADGVFYRLSIKDNHFNQDTIHPIVWGGTILNGLSSGNINIASFGMHDCDAITYGSVIVNSDYYDPAFPDVDTNKRIRKEDTFDILTSTEYADIGGYKAQYWGMATRLTSTLDDVAFTAGETKQLAFVFKEEIYSDDIVSMPWIYDDVNGQIVTFKHWYRSADKLTVYFPVTNNEASSISIQRIRVTVLKPMVSIQG